MKRLFCSVVVLFAAAVLYADTPAVPRDATWVTDGKVSAVAVAGGKVYIGGEFTNVGPFTGSACLLGAVTGNLRPSFPRFDGTVYAVAADGSGGWFVGGEFTRAGNVDRRNAAHVLADGSVDTNWDLSTNGPVYAFAVAGSTVIIGGRFATIAGRGCSNIAAFDMRTGRVSPVGTGTDNAVNALAFAGNTVFVGGAFSHFSGNVANCIAAFDPGTGMFIPVRGSGLNKPVLALAYAGGKLLVGGEFDTVVATYCPYFGVYDPVSRTWSLPPSGTNGTVRALAADGNTVYASGAFTNILGQQRMNCAAIDMAGEPQVAGWNPVPDGPVYALVVGGGMVYAAGDFKNIGGRERHCFATLDKTTGAAAEWQADANGTGRALAISGNTLCAGGGFTGVGLQPRANIAALDAATGAATAWAPRLDGPVSALAVNGGKVYAGGTFSHVGNVVQGYIASWSTTTGIMNAWMPLLDGEVCAFAFGGGKIFVGGRFKSVDNKIRYSLASWDATTGRLSNWAPGLGGDIPFVKALAVSGNTLYAGGRFTSVDGAARGYGAAWDLQTNALTAWNPRADFTINAFAVQGSTVYAGGSFTRAGGRLCEHLAALDATTGGANSWYAGTNGNVLALAVGGDMLFAGGEFRFSSGSWPDEYMAAFPTVNGTARWENPNVDSAVSALAMHGDTLYAGGSFSTVGGRYRPNFAQFGEYVPLAVSGAAPASGPLAGGTRVTITGTSLAPGAAVTVGGIPATEVQYVSATRLTAVVPAGTVGAKNVTVTNPDGESGTLTAGFTYTITGAGAGIDPANGGVVTIIPVTGGITVTVPGGAFGSAVTLSLSTAAVPSSRQETVRPTGIGIELTNNLGLQPSRPLTITISYRDADIVGLDESRLIIARWDNGRWIPIPSTVDAAANTVTGTVAHLSTFAIVQLVPARNLAGVNVFPNPYNPKNGQFIFDNLTTDAEVQLYTVTGELVRTLNPSSTGRIAWDGKNDGGTTVASGVYLARIKSSAGDRKIKIAVQR